MSGGVVGTSMHMEKNPAKRKRHLAYLRAEERRWARRSGPVRVRFDPSVKTYPSTDTT